MFSFVRKHAAYAGEVLAAAALMAAASWLGLHSQLDQNFAPVYPENGIGLALLWRYGPRYWPAVFIASTLSSHFVGTPLFTATAVGWLDVLLAMVALACLSRWQVQPSLERRRDLSGFTLAILIASSLAIPIYGYREVAVFGDTAGHALSLGIHYFLSAFFSYLILTPLILVWTPDYLQGRKRAWSLGATTLAILAIGWLILAAGPALRERLLFLLVPFVVMAAVIGRIGGAALAAACMIFILMILGGRTVVSLQDDAVHTVFIALATLTGYLLAAVFAEREHAVAELNYRARHDTLTGLINRYEFENRLHGAIQDRAGRYALLYLDLDQFKLVNDTCGHLAGDDMLHRLAGTLESALPPGAVLARLGGDEFGYLLPASGLPEAEACACGIHDTIRGFRYVVGELSFTVGGSIGATLLSPDDRAPDDVLRRADIACYAAKESGRNRTSVYTPTDAAMNRRHADIYTLSQLQTALEGGLFQLHAQRIHNIADVKDTAPFYEVLLRYADTESGRAIGDILENAQRYGVIAQVDRWVFEQSARFLERSRDKHLRLSINVAAITLESPGFGEFILGLPARYGFDARQMCIEITEVVAVQNLTAAVGVLQQFRERGFDVALDDFGAGVASFGYLRELPVSMVKIDGHFVRDLGRDPAAAVVIESLVRVSTLRGLTCIAEWVEESAQIPRLRALGVTYVQGYAIHKPVPMSSIE